MRRASAVLLFVGVLIGCRSAPPPNTPATAGFDPATLVDPAAAEDGAVLTRADLASAGEAVKARRRPAVPPPKRTILALSGGGQFGAFTAGVLCGWTEAGGRPRFDVVTGVSAGALNAALAFPGSDYDPQLKWFGTQLTADMVYTKRRLLTALRSDSFADSAPLAGQIARIVTPEYLCRVVKEHAAGRRFYVGTTDYEAGRLVVWDMGAIATRGTPQAADLYQKVLLASSSIPGFFPPVNIPVTVNGRCLVEPHVDGGVSAGVFARAPAAVSGSPRGPESLYGSDLYVIVAGKLFADPKAYKPKLTAIAGQSVSLLTYAQVRDELVKLYAATVLGGMNFYVAAMPPDFEVKSDATAFDRGDMARMFEEGRRLALTGTAWQTVPPGLSPGEEESLRTGNQLFGPPPRCE